jgi:hypothetical protein
MYMHDACLPPLIQSRYFIFIYNYDCTSLITSQPLFFLATANPTLVARLSEPEKWILFGARAEILLFTDSLLCVEPKGASLSA